MAFYEPKQSVHWKYRQDEGDLLIVSTVDMDIDTEVDKNVTAENSGLVDGKFIVIDLTVNTEGTQVSSPVTLVSEVLIESIGTNQSLSYVQAKIASHSPVSVTAVSYKNGVEVASTKGEGDISNQIDYD